LEEIPEQVTDDVLGDPSCLENVDVICLTYDSANPDSFAFIADLRVHHTDFVFGAYLMGRIDSHI
jgi:hypothetical protein